MGAVDTTYTFTATDTITSAKMNNIIDQTTITTDAIIGTTLDVASGKLKVRASGITANEIAAGQITPALTNFASSLLPAGAVMAFAMNTAPSGWLAADGSSVSTSGVNAALFAAIGYTYGGSGGSFNLPDLRGEFVRGWDDGRGIDSGRVIGSAQGSQNLAHNHTGTTDSQGSHTHGVPLTNGVSSGAVTVPGDEVNKVRTNTCTTDAAGAHTHTLTIANSGGTEARPRNIAMLYCIKL